MQMLIESDHVWRSRQASDKLRILLEVGIGTKLDRTIADVSVEQPQKS